MTLMALQPDNLPTIKDETWKYTNLVRAVPDNLKRADNEEEQIVHIKSREVREKPQHIRFTGVDGAYHVDQLKIKLEDGAQLTVIEHHEGRGVYWKNRVTEIELGRGARLYHYRVQDDSVEAVNTNMVHMSLARDAVYDSFNLNMGGKLSRHEIHAVLNEENVECHFNGLNLLKGKQHGDTTILIEHKAPHGRSNQFYRSVLDDQARGVFQGKVHVHQAAQKTDGYQLSNAILLSERAEMDTKPELEIYADDVKCSHGATTGQLDEEPLFYLRTRGLNDGQARLLLMQAFVDELVEKIGDEAHKTEIGEKVRQWLQTALSQ